MVKSFIGITVAGGLGIAALLATGCDRLGADGTNSKERRVQMIDRQGKNVGSIELTETGGGVQITGRVSGLTPGEHGFHIHESGVCNPPDFKTAGDHLNPTKMKHGSQNPAGPHLGDLGNITADSNGVADIRVTATNATLVDGERALLRNGAAALMVHAKPDDQRTDPSGNSGDRVACGIIRDK